MYKRNEWNENEKFSPKNTVQDVLKKAQTVKASCCIDTTSLAAGPCGSDIKTSCCIDTTKE